MRTIIDTETLEEFYKLKFSDTSSSSNASMGNFNAFVIEDVVSPEHEVLVRYARRDFYKICFMYGNSLIHYSDRTLKVESPTLIFFNPQTPYKWESLEHNEKGFFCIFREEFFKEKLRSNLGDLPVFSAEGVPSRQLNDGQSQHVSNIFAKILLEMNSDYQYKQDLLVSYVTELVHFALKLDAKENLAPHIDANSRLTSIFAELLERQFPVVSIDQRLRLRSAKDFAENLHVHVNHLNRAIKLTTGKTTSHLIGKRIAIEAKVMLKHTSWNVSEVGYSLGFEDAAHFNNFFKKHTKVSPKEYRLQEAVTE